MIAGSTFSNLICAFKFSFDLLRNSLYINFIPRIQGFTKELDYTYYLKIMKGNFQSSNKYFLTKLIFGGHVANR